MIRLLMIVLLVLSIYFGDVLAGGTAHPAPGGGVSDVGGMLPPVADFTFAAIVFLLLALILFIAELQIISHGILGTGGVVSLVVGVVLLLESPETWLRIPPWLLILVAGGVIAFFVFAMGRTLKAHKGSPATGREGMIGETGVADTDLNPAGKVVVHGEYWNARSETPVARGERIIVTGIEGLSLKVQGKGERDD